MKSSLSTLQANCDEAFKISTSVDRVSGLEKELFQKKTEITALLGERADIQSKLDSALSDSKNKAEKIDEIKGYYEKEVTNLRIQLKNSSIRVSKSRFCSTTNMITDRPSGASEPPTKPKVFQHASERFDYSGSSPNASKHKLERQDSLAKQSWSDIKNLIHATGEGKKNKMNSGMSRQSKGSVSKKKSSSSSSSNLEHPLEELEPDMNSNSSSDEKIDLIPNTCIIGKKSQVNRQAVRLSLNIPHTPKSAQTLPPASAFIKAGSSSPVKPKFAHQSINQYQDRFEQTKSELETLKLEIGTYEMKLKKKDEHISELKKRCEELESQVTLKKKEKEVFRNELVDKDKDLIISHCLIQDLKTQIQEIASRQPADSAAADKSKYMAINEKLADVNNKLRQENEQLADRLMVN
jgi:hypothetical protein